MSDKRAAMTKTEAGKEVVSEVKAHEKAKATRTRAVVSAPKPPPVKIHDVENPIVANKSLKRALAVAIVATCTHGEKVDIEKAAAMIRTSGILFKAGYTKEAPTDALSKSEWSGKPYARWVTNTPEGKVFPEKFPEKLKLVKPFAKVLKEAVEEELKKETAKA